MTADFQDIFTVYLVPFAIAVPLAILLFLLVTRRDTDDTRRPREPLPPAPAAPRVATAPARSAAAATAVPPTVAVAAPPPMTPFHLLVADDSAVARAKLRKLFESAGYLVDVAVDGEEALDLLGRKRYAVLITDLEMPKMDGFQVIAAVQGSLETEDLPIIAITGHEELSARVHDMEGLYGLFKKPWNDRDLLKRVATVATLSRPTATG